MVLHPFFFFFNYKYDDYKNVVMNRATSPPSFALEVFVQCEGETRFRRLCQPFLYSHSSSNVLEVEVLLHRV